MAGIASNCDLERLRRLSALFYVGCQTHRHAAGFDGLKALSPQPGFLRALPLSRRRQNVLPVLVVPPYPQNGIPKGDYPLAAGGIVLSYPRTFRPPVPRTSARRPLEGTAAQ